ncbi:hypothetical protein F444_15133 [Phytophthora nicotianae P1976]|nr:hypothetical protein F444_15133 [Phytophthora nicotianae P1976]
MTKTLPGPRHKDLTTALGIHACSPFYLVHGWDARSTLEATLSLGSTRCRDMEPRQRRYNVQQQYQQTHKLVNEALRDAIEGRADQHNEDVSSYDIKDGDRVWLYLDQVKEGYARKLAHMWHGPFRVAETLKLVKSYPVRPTSTLTNREADRVDFDEGLLPEDRQIATGSKRCSRMRSKRWNICGGLATVEK